MPVKHLPGLDSMKIGSGTRIGFPTSNIEIVQEMNTYNPQAKWKRDKLEKYVKVYGIGR